MEIRGDFQALYAEGRRLESVAEDLATGVSRIGVRVQELLAGGWTGAAAHDFEVAFNDWLGAADSAVTNLRGLSEAVRSTATDMAMTEERHQGRVDALSNGLEAAPGPTPRTGPSFGYGQLMGGES